MGSERMLVLEMLRDGKITVEEAERLLKAMEGKKESTFEELMEDLGQRFGKVGREVRKAVRLAWSRAAVKEVKDAVREAVEELGEKAKKLREDLESSISSAVGTKGKETVSEAVLSAQGVRKLEVRNRYGRVKVSQGHGEISARALVTKRAEVSPLDVKIVTFQQGDEARIEVSVGEEGKVSVDLEVEVPKGIEVTVETEEPEK